MPAGDPPLTLRDLAAMPVESASRRRREEGAGARRGRDPHRARPRCTHYPRRHLDRTREATIADLQKGDEATVFGEVRSCSDPSAPKGRRTLTDVVIGDGGNQLTLTFFNQRWREKQLHARA